MDEDAVGREWAVGDRVEYIPYSLGYHGHPGDRKVEPSSARRSVGTVVDVLTEAKEIDGITIEANDRHPRYVILDDETKHRHGFQGREILRRLQG
mmetsp:Transcript_2149/g.4015  ORF Transcript_2149/g.4015 Transcript_2149/m.4015 type:complete len:95 (+) Transcript_2149:112-396(+)|eukprot:CAMPEP_0196661458 /NCGR_PEP_ID=MMETSP1086-20130531/44391_1 /TAXON_ID=77921 /ORGANISM="Cyanoptyche  gloeocystis , Strain SAG4.97" /LENGTH=94 /DNA_ID=CAMNT_0041996365 /DNA_START=114 /DNA_END=398 /DNA_ORIENTATION=+